jgi:PleD family two-component response regulator
VLIGQSRVTTPEGPLGVTVSIGVAMARSGDDAEMLLDRADRRLLEAKRAGRDRVVGPDSP